MNEDHARRAATAMKVIHLARLPGMDLVAIKLNCEPTHPEVRTALRWQRALELAATDMSAVDIARALLKEYPSDDRI